MSSYSLQGKWFHPLLVLALKRHHRPESIGEGFHRLYLSNDFKTADADLTERINQVTRELEAIALELASCAGHVSRRKRSRVDATGKPALTGENTHPRDVSSTQPSRGDATSNNAAGTSSATTVTRNAHAIPIAGTPNQPTPWMSQNEVATVVHLLMFVIQLLFRIIC
jgi:hypothetical protein